MAVDADARTIRCAGGAYYRYRDLILAVGLVPDDAALPGIDAAMSTPAVASNYLNAAEKTWRRRKRKAMGLRFDPRKIQ